MSLRTVTLVMALAMVVLLYATVPGAHGQRLPNRPGDFKCNCEKTFNPVCGNDGLNYLNKCVLNCGKRFKEGLALKYEDYCAGSDPYAVQGSFDPDRPFWG